MEDGCYLCIDLKSFYASVECVQRGLDPLKARLVVADPDRGQKTICLAVTPALKKMGINSRCRLFDIPASIEYIKARPRMRLYMKYAADIYKIYLRYFSRDDIYVYSIDEVFIDAGRYRKMYGNDMKALSERIMKSVLETTGITAACGIGTNLYLAKVALDIMAKKSENGIGILDEKIYREKLWDHRPLTDFWRIGRATADKLAGYGIYTMRQVAAADSSLLYRKFGIDAELLIDHARGIETASISDIKAYLPRSRSLTSGQVLPAPYDSHKTRLVIKEMIEELCLELTGKGLVASAVGLSIGYSGRWETVSSREILPFDTDSYTVISEKADRIFERIVDKSRLMRRINIYLDDVHADENQYFDFFYSAEAIEKERHIAEAVLDIREKYGKNAVFRAMSLEEGSTAAQRNQQIGGHKA